MLSQTYYAIRSKEDGRYLVAHPHPEDKSRSYLLLFSEDFEAINYLTTHAGELASRFALESISSTQFGALVDRWNFSGFGVVRDPLLPQVEFFGWKGPSIDSSPMG